MMRRRALWRLPAAAALAALAPAAAQQRAAPPGHALRIGADPAIAALAAELRRGFIARSGLALQLDIGPSAALLEAIERGELDGALTLAPEAEQRLVALGLAHDRRPLGSLELLLVGPIDVLPRGRDALQVLRGIAAGALPYVGRTDGSGLHLAEQALWRAAGHAPAAPWLFAADAAPLAQARALRAFLLVERTGWRSPPPRERYGVVVEGDPQLLLPLHALRAFRSAHSASKLFVEYAGGPAGRRAIAGRAGVLLATERR